MDFDGNVKAIQSSDIKFYYRGSSLDDNLIIISATLRGKKDNNLNVEVANDNTPSQVVISGMLNNIDKSRDIFLKNGVRKFVKLNVSAAFHSNLMLEAQNIMKKYINDTIFSNSNLLFVYFTDFKLKSSLIILTCSKDRISMGAI